jgi:hypothetical protein
VCLKQGAEETLETKNEKNNRWPEKIAWWLNSCFRLQISSAVCLRLTFLWDVALCNIPEKQKYRLHVCASYHVLLGLSNRGKSGRGR